MKSYKSAGFQIESSQINDEQALSRLGLILATATLYLVNTGVAVVATGQRRKDDAVPRISWGRYYADGQKILLPYSVQVNHAFVDGIHIGRFKEKLEENMMKINDI